MNIGNDQNNQREGPGDADWEKRLEIDYAASQKLVASHAALLHEHFDSVVIIATRYDGSHTGVWHAGGGNWYARVASAQEFCARAQVQMMGKVNPNG